MFWSIVNSIISHIGSFTGFLIAGFLFTVFWMAEEISRSFFLSDCYEDKGWYVEQILRRVINEEVINISDSRQRCVLCHA